MYVIAKELYNFIPLSRVSIMRKISRFKGKKIIKLERYHLTEVGLMEALHYPYQDNSKKIFDCLYKSNNPLNVLQMQARTGLSVPKINCVLYEFARKGYVETV